jgi:hypothetical protein
MDWSRGRKLLPPPNHQKIKSSCRPVWDGSVSVFSSFFSFTPLTIPRSSSTTELQSIWTYLSCYLSPALRMQGFHETLFAWAYQSKLVNHSAVFFSHDKSASASASASTATAETISRTGSQDIIFFVQRFQGVHRRHKINVFSGFLGISFFSVTHPERNLVYLFFILITTLDV